MSEHEHVARGEEQRRRWSESEVALLGQFTDAEVARRVGRERLAVMSKRQKLGIERVQRKDLWTESDLSMLGRLKDSEVAQRTGRSKTAVRNKRYSLRVQVG